MPPQNVSLKTDDELQWKIVGLVILTIRFVQGWIFWGGGSRRFIYDPTKLDPYSPQWMANKFQSAMPGALLGMEHIVSFILQHFVLLYISILIFSLAELICGVGLLFGFFTRLAAFGTALISIILMLLFGWQGSTCLDEWTMAVSNLSMGLTLTLAGGSIYSIDHAISHHYPKIAKKWWFLTFASGAWSYVRLKQVSIIFLIFTFVFTLVTYNYYRGSILTPYHAGPVSSGAHHLTLGNGDLKTNGSVSFVLYVDAGTPAVPAHIIRIELMNQSGSTVEVWQGKDLNNLPTKVIKNIYEYNLVSIGPYGIVAPLSAKAEIELPPAIDHLKLPSGSYQLKLYTINGDSFSLPLQVS